MDRRTSQQSQTRTSTRVPWPSAGGGPFLASGGVSSAVLPRWPWLACWAAGSLDLAADHAAAIPAVGVTFMKKLPVTGSLGPEPSPRNGANSSNFNDSPGRDGLFAAIIVEAALRLAAEPAGLDVFHQE